MAVKRFLIQGIVQGVGFRYFALRSARGLSLAGYVRNLPDGSVEAVARGEAKGLAALEAALRRGPPGSRVDAIDVQDDDRNVPGDDFVIR
jgi:acylphosphatase